LQLGLHFAAARTDDLIIDAAAAHVPARLGLARF